MSRPDDESIGSDRSELQRQAIRGASWTVVHTLVSLPIAFGVNLVLARVLGVVDYGRLPYLTLVITIAGSIAAMGVGTGVLQFGAKAHAAGRASEVRRLLSAGSGWRLLISAPVVTLAVLAFVRLDTTTTILALIFGVWVPSALGGLGHALNIENKTARGAQLAMVGNLVTQAAVLLALFWRQTPDAVWAARVIASSVVVLLLFPSISKAYRRAVIHPSNPFALSRAFWRFSLPAGAAGLIGMLVTSRTELLFLEWLSDPVAVGLFSLAFGLTTHLFAPAQAFVGPLVPALSGLAEVDPPAVRRAYLRVLRCSSAVAGLLAASVLPAFAALVPLLYGHEYSQAASLVLVLGAVTAVGILNGPLTAFVMARLGGARMLRVDFFALVINLAAALAFIPLLDAWGAVAASVSGTLARLAMLLVGESHHLGVPNSTTWLSIGPAFVSILVAVASWLATWPLAGTDMLRGAVALGLGTFGFLVGIRILGLGISREDRAALANVAPRRARSIAHSALGLVTSSR